MTIKAVLPIFLCMLAFGSKLAAQAMNNTDISLNAGKVLWQQRKIDMGEIKFGIPASCNFDVQNISSDTLILQNVRVGCHCTTVEWTKTPIAPGESGTIKATYDALKEGPYYKIITVATNFDPKQPVALTLVGTVLPQPADQVHPVDKQ
jgi:hypothetical protein